MSCVQRKNYDRRYPEKTTGLPWKMKWNGMEDEIKTVQMDFVPPESRREILEKRK